MKKLLLVSGLATVSVLMSGMAAAQGVGKVISSTPVTKKVTEPKTTCTNDAAGKEHCQTKSVTENRTVAYNVVYEYAGHKHTAQMPFQPGPTIELEVMPRALAAPAKTAAPAKPQVKTQAQTQAQAKPQTQAQSKPQPQPSYSTEPQPYYSAEAPRTYSSPPQTVYSQPAEVVERYVREPEYVESVYYPQTYYYPSSYYSPRSYYAPRSYYSPSYYADPFYPVVGLALGYSVGRYGHSWRGGYSHHGHHRGHHGHRGPGRGR